MTLATAPTHITTDPGFVPLKKYIIDVTGLAYYADKNDDLAARIAERLAVSPAACCSSYLYLLEDPKHGDVELDQLVELLTVGETFFFRHTELFDGLREIVLPDLLQRNRSVRRLRIWCAGCSTGAEPYSLAILLAREFPDVAANWEISILGTDINRRFLARAEEGAFREWDFRGTSLSEIKDCFTKRGAEWVLRPEYRHWISFQYHNLVRHAYPSLITNLVAFDLVLCRNVLIYFSADIIQRVVSQMHDCLVDGGWLLVGHAEPNTRWFRRFRTVNVPGAVLYQRLDAPTPAASVPAAPAPSARPLLAPPSVAPPSNARPSASDASSRKRRRRGARAKPTASPANKRPTGEPLERVRWLADNGDLDAAVAECKQLAASDPMNPDFHLHLALLAEQQGDRHQAETSLRRTLYLCPGNALAHYTSGLLQQKQGRCAEAIRSYRNVLDLLEACADAKHVPGADGLTVGELRELARMQQEVLRSS